MRSGRYVHAVPEDVLQIYAFDALTVQVNFVTIGETLNLFGHASFGPMTFIQEWRHNCETGLRSDRHMRERKRRAPSARQVVREGETACRCTATDKHWQGNPDIRRKSRKMIVPGRKFRAT